MTFKKYGLGKSTELKFKLRYGINLKNKNLFLKNNIKTIFNRLNCRILTGKKLFRRVNKDIDFQKNVIKSYLGTRHRKNYPVRGQRTHTNATKKVFKKKNFF